MSLVIVSDEAQRVFSQQFNPVTGGNVALDLVVTGGLTIGASKVVLRLLDTTETVSVRVSWSTDGSPSGDPGLGTSASAGARETLLGNEDVTIISRATDTRVTDLHFNYDGLSPLSYQVVAFQ